MQALQNSSLQSLLQKGQLWQAGQSVEQGQQRIATGHGELDKLLQGGLQPGQLHEIQVPRWFCGELTLLSGALRLAAEEQRPVFWVNPPAAPYAPGLSYAGAAHSPHSVLTDLRDDEASWAMEMILQAGCAAVVIGWCPALSVNGVRRLQRAVQGTSTLAVVISTELPSEARSYQVRLRVHLHQSRLRWQVIKRPGGWPCELDWESVPVWKP